MYRLLIVDDEEIEREGMATSISWEKHNVKLVGTAWNGAEAFDKIQKLLPDIVLTDIKMPVMDGIALIRETKKVYPDTEFIVLSGYGEFEYTSQTMEEGIRHYILKPCDENSITIVLDKVIKEIERKKASKIENEHNKRTVHRLLPRAREQLFRNMMLDLECVDESYHDFRQEIRGDERQVCIVGFRSDKPFDSLELFLLGNIYGELIGEDKLMATAPIQNDVMMLIEPDTTEHLENALCKTRKQFSRIKRQLLWAVVSMPGTIEECHKLYLQTQELFALGELEKREELFCFERLKKAEELNTIFSYKRFQNIASYEKALYECSLFFMKMDILELGYMQKRQTCMLVLKILYGDDVSAEVDEMGQMNGDTGELMKRTADIIACRQIIETDTRVDEKRMRTIMQEIYGRINNMDLNIQYLTKQILFMNEDYFGRLFVKYQHERFSSFLLNKRIMFAKELIHFKPDIKISALAEMVGYASDGQYFAKAFRRIEGISPSEYKEKMKQDE
ncbi:MAG: response regulator [bacterium]|nr:response regulator [bacterium]